MASTSDMLLTTLGETAYNALGVLAGSRTPMSGRMVGTALGVAPSTATAVLGKLREAGFATSSREGRADRWHLNTDNTVLRSWLEETRGEPSSAKAPGGMSPYPTGGGGVTFERKVAVQYLAHLLVGDGAVELGDGRCVVSVAFQQAPEHSVDDLVIRAARVDELEPSLVLAVGVRRSPDLVQSDESTKKLIRAFVHEVINAPVDGPEQRVALVVAGAQDHAEQLAWLADLASKQMDAPSFFGLVRTPAKFPASVRGRLDQIEALVRLALSDLGVADPGPQVVQQRTWELLSRLTVLMPRLETPDDADWAAVTNALIPVARGADLYGASRLRDRLVALANEYSPTAATVDLSLLRRDAHEVLDATTRRHRQGWGALDHLHARAIASVRDEIASSDGSRAVHIDRSDAAAELLAVPGSATLAVVAHGDSGVGKSALVVGALTGAASSDPDITQALCINLRHLPTTTLELESILATPLATLLAELSAPTRLLVIDGADAISEGKLEPFRYLVDAGLKADMLVIAVTASDTKQLVRDAIAERSGGNVAEYLVPPLTDPQVDDVVATFAELAALATNPRSRELLRRPVVVDLLVRGGLAGIPLSDADAMRQVWSGLVRRHEQSDRGTPDARELALLRLADLALCGGDALDVVGAIDPTALDGLRHDGLLRTSIDDPFRIGPEFAHDEVRRYAVARLILAAGHATSKLVDAGVPRWALGAARLACQALLAEPDTPSNPLHGRFARLQEAFDDLVDAGHGDRWGDVPGEALLTLGDPDPVLRDAWPKLRAEPGAGLQRLSRLVDQRLRDEKGLVRTVRRRAADQHAARRRDAVVVRRAPARPVAGLAARSGYRQHIDRISATPSPARPARRRLRGGGPPSASGARRRGCGSGSPLSRRDRGKNASSWRATALSSPRSAIRAADVVHAERFPLRSPTTSWSSCLPCSVPILAVKVRPSSAALRTTHHRGSARCREAVHRSRARNLPAGLPRRADRGLLPRRRGRRVGFPRGRHQGPRRAQFRRHASCSVVPRPVHAAASV